LTFAYVPPPGSADLPVVFAFPPVPRSPAYKRAFDVAERCLRGTRFLRLFIRNAYTICRPDDVRASGEHGAVTGSLRLPRLEHADHGYLAHVDGNGDLYDLTPLRIVRSIGREQ
jgi:hypothetical protein